MQTVIENFRGNSSQQEYSALVKLSLTDFRSYKFLRLDVEVGPVVLVGANGVGKTNLLEAISFLGSGRGLRRARLNEVTCGDHASSHATGLEWAVAGTIETSDGFLEIATGYETGPTSEAGGRRIIRLNGLEAKSQAALDEVLAAVWIVPEMDRLFVDSPSERRRFLDRMVAAFDVCHSTQLKTYEKAMRERTRLLRDDNSLSGLAQRGWIDALESRMAESGVAIAAARKSYIKKLSAAFRLSVGSFPAGTVTMHGGLEEWLEGSPALQVEDKFKEMLAASRITDREAGRALSGPHRSDIHVMHLGKNRPAALCSTGEQKALLISIVLAHARLISLDRGCPPLLLMDEIVAHLDAVRRAALYEEICSIGAQSWMTGTDPESFQDFQDRAQIFQIENGTVHRI